jgi:imidazolonepropionase-like amidohydrolase
MNRRLRRNRNQATCPPAVLLALALGCHSAGRTEVDTVARVVSPPLTLQHGTLINPDARPIPDANVVVQNGRIVCAGTATACPRPAGSKPIDVTASYVGPGLVDAHVHYSQTGWLDGRPDALDLRAQYPYDSVVNFLQMHPERFYRADLCSGVTSVFDVGGFSWTYDLARKSRGAADSPRVVAAGPLLATITIDSQMMPAFVFMKDEATVREAVRAHRQAGADAIKVWYIEVPDSLRPHAKAMLMAAADETRKAGLRLLVHATELHTAKDAVEAGAAVLVHEVESDTVDADLIAAIKQKGTIVIPTLSVIEGYADVFLGRSPADRYPLDCVDPATRRLLETIVPDSVQARGKAFWSGPGRQIRQLAAENLRRMYQAGVPIAMGTDAGNPGTAHGPSVYAEMEAMQQAGMPAKAVFASATIVGAKAIALDREIGSVEAGKRADLVVFAADPSADSRNARQVRLVMRNGVIRSRQELLPH